MKITKNVGFTGVTTYTVTLGIAGHSVVTSFDRPQSGALDDLKEHVLSRYGRLFERAALSHKWGEAFDHALFERVVLSHKRGAAFDHAQAISDAEAEVREAQAKLRKLRAQLGERY